SDATAEVAAVAGHQVRAVVAAVEDAFEQLLLGAEVAGHQGRVDADIAGDVAHADVIVALPREPFARGLEDSGAGGLGVSRPGRDMAKQQLVSLNSPNADMALSSPVDKRKPAHHSVTGRCLAASSPIAAVDKDRDFSPHSETSVHAHGETRGRGRPRGGRALWLFPQERGSDTAGP